MKNIIALGMLLVLAACSSPENKNALTVRYLFETFNRHDWQTMANLYAKDALFLDPSFGKEFVVKARSETITKYAEMEKTFPDIHDTITSIYSNENTVTVEFTSTGTAADGSTFSLPVVSILTFKHGLIVKDATYYDL